MALTKKRGTRKRKKKKEKQKDVRVERRDVRVSRRACQLLALKLLRIKLVYEGLSCCMQRRGTGRCASSRQPRLTRLLKRLLLVRDRRV
jgi:hypothetical protein